MAYRVNHYDKKQVSHMFMKQCLIGIKKGKSH